MNILLIEDDDGIANALALGLNRDGHRSQRAATGHEALTAPSADVILLDIGLPDMDGFEVLRLLRKRGDRTRVVVMTARDDPELRLRALAEGAVAFLRKPFAMDELRAVVGSDPHAHAA